MFRAILEKISVSSCASLKQALHSTFKLGAASASSLSQYFVSLASFLQMKILFLKSFLLEAPFASA